MSAWSTRALDSSFHRLCHTTNINTCHFFILPQNPQIPWAKTVHAVTLLVLTSCILVWHGYACSPIRVAWHKWGKGKKQMAVLSGVPRVVTFQDQGNAVCEFEHLKIAGQIGSLKGSLKWQYPWTPYGYYLSPKQSYENWKLPWNSTETCSRFSLFIISPRDPFAVKTQQPIWTQYDVVKKKKKTCHMNFAP